MGSRNFHDRRPGPVVISKTQAKAAAELTQSIVTGLPAGIKAEDLFGLPCLDGDSTVQRAQALATGAQVLATTSPVAVLPSLSRLIRSAGLTAPKARAAQRELLSWAGIHNAIVATTADGIVQPAPWFVTALRHSTPVARVYDPGDDCVHVSYLTENKFLCLSVPIRGDHLNVDSATVTVRPRHDNGLICGCTMLGAVCPPATVNLLKKGAEAAILRCLSGG